MDNKYAQTAASLGGALDKNTFCNANSVFTLVTLLAVLWRDLAWTTLVLRGEQRLPTLRLLYALQTLPVPRQRLLVPRDCADELPDSSFGEKNSGERGQTHIQREREREIARGQLRNGRHERRARGG